MMTTEKPQSRLLRGLFVSGAVLLVPMLLLVIRIVWEETWLTLHQGPQMVGFSLAHGYWAPLLLTPAALLLWLVLALVATAVTTWKERVLWRPMVAVLATSVVLLGILSLPALFWQWVFIGSFARSPQAGELMTTAAAQGYTRVVRGYLRHGVPVEAKNYEGSTSAFAAAAGGSVPILHDLADRGADLSAVNLFGDSPLQAAVRNHQNAAVNFLRQHGARQIEGTEAQRAAAIHAIVQRQVQSLDNTEKANMH